METVEAAELDDLVIQEFESGLRGRILRPGDADYDVARRHYNALINKHPAPFELLLNEIEGNSK